MVRFFGCLVFVTLLFPAVVFANPGSKFTEKLFSYHEASMGYVAPYFNSVLDFSKMIEGVGDFSKVIENGEPLKSGFEKFETTRNDLIAYADANQKALKAVGDVVAGVKKEADDESMARFKRYSDAYMHLSKSSKLESFTVYANEGWANTGINVQSGDIILIRPSGSWSVSPNYDPVDWKGFKGNKLASYALTNQAPMGALIYRVRGGAHPNGNGFNKNLGGTVDGSGRLEMTINDRAQKNNTGQMNVQIFVIDSKVFSDLLGSLKKP